jgi:S1-C subfamily serine protease
MRHRHWQPALLLAGLALASLPGTAVGGEDARIARTFTRFGPGVVPVHYTLRLLETPQGGQGGKVEGVMCGVLVGRDGLIITTADVFPDLDGDPRQIFVPVAFHVRPPGGGEYVARAVGLDRTLNLAFLRLDRPQDFPTTGVSFARRAPVPGEKVVLLGLLGEQYRHAPTFTEARIVSAVSQPHPLFTLDALVQDLTIGGLVVTPKGEALGMIGEDTLASLPSGPSDLAAAGGFIERREAFG